MKLFFALLIALPVAYSWQIWPSQLYQSVAVKGKLLCHDEPAGDVRVKLYEKEVFVDALFDDKYSDGNGTFFLSGGGSEYSTIEPHVNIYHDCDDTIPIVNIDKPCQRRVKIRIPQEYTVRADTPTRVFDLGTIQLAGVWPGETTDCIHKR